MRLILGLCALAISGGALSAQTLDATRQPSARNPHYASAAYKARTLSPHAAPGDRRGAEAERAARDRARADRAGPRAARHGDRDPRSDARRAGRTISRGPSRLRRRASAAGVGIGLAVPFPDKFRLEQPHRLADIHASESNYRLQQQIDRAASVGDLRLAARRAQAPRHPARGADARVRLSQPDAGALRRRHGGEARRDPGAGRASRSPTTI